MKLYLMLTDKATLSRQTSRVQRNVSVREMLSVKLSKCIEAPPIKESVSRALRVTTSAESQLESERKKNLREMLIEPDVPDNEREVCTFGFPDRAS